MGIEQLRGVARPIIDGRNPVDAAISLADLAGLIAGFLGSEQRYIVAEHFRAIATQIEYAGALDEVSL